jgi:endo-1,4-beta-xylanase
MHFRSSLVIGMATGFLVVSWSGCSDQGAGMLQGSGGSAASENGGAPGAGGEAATGGVSGTGGAVGSGGASVGTGGGPGMGGKPGTGGSAGLGSGAVESGGVLGGGGTTNSAGAAGGNGRPDGGGRSDGSVRSEVGPSGTGGGSGGGGAGSGGGSTGNGGSTGSPGTTKKFVGNIDTRGSIRSDFKTYWDQFSPENAGKWGSVQGGGQSSFSWNSLDAMYKYCNDNNIIFKQHCFVWGAQQPTWTDSLSTSNGPSAVQNWMKTYCQRYPKVAIIDVVNEPPPHTTPKYANAIGGGTNGTWEWIANAFKWAREACPNAILVLNDYNNAELSGDAQHTSDIVNAIKKLNAPIDAVGCQLHGASNSGSSGLKTNIDKIGNLTGLPIYITEYDINVADDNQQKTRYQDHITMFWNHSNIKGITVWGYIVGATWQSNTGIMQSSGTMRPAMTWLMDFLKR